MPSNTTNEKTKAYPLVEDDSWLGKAGEASVFRGPTPRSGETWTFLFGVGVEEADEARLNRRFGVLL